MVFHAVSELLFAKCTLFECSSLPSAFLLLEMDGDLEYDRISSWLLILIAFVLTSQF